MKVVDLKIRACSQWGENAELALPLKETVDKKLHIVANLDEIVVDNLSGERFALGAR